jgi:16S rRNA (guanine(966)-N(2))-methyltransferase RsmD|tara:strand:- start:807 stop:1352 length:546 start_codon:yes stop_codon:yes gene_type:complete
MLTVSNGSKKGFRLKVPSGNLVRPKTSKIRKMIFDILVSVHNMNVLDIFAGSGSLGIEALSMGARHATFIDINASSIKSIKENLKKCEFDNSSTVIKRDFAVALRELRKQNEKFDLIFIDPPYSYFDEKTVNGIIRTALKLSVSDGVVVCEHPKEEEIEIDVSFCRVKKYKDKYITFCWSN